MIPVSNDLTDRDPIDLIAEEFADRCRRGDSPTVDEYLARYPEYQEELRQLLPTVGFLEKGRNELSKPKPVEPVTTAVRFGEHRVVKEIGRGGMGIVYEAIQEPLGRRVAVKVLPRHSAADPRSRERFLREAKAVARLKHPHIVPIFSVGEWENVPYYVMALIEGIGLDKVTDAPQDGPARARWTAELGVQAAEALAHAHGAGILHRDVKPANLLLEPSGQVWLTDFGLAKLADDLSLTETGGLPGTLRYLAPECLDAEGDVRSDIYSLGLTLYELLLGRPAFGDSNRLRLLKQVRDCEIAAPRSVDPTIPRDLETILLKATDRDPAKRYASTVEFGDDLRRFVEGRPILARRVGPVERLRSWMNRNPLVTGLTTATVVLSLVSAVFVGLWLRAPERDRDRPPFRPAETKVATAPAPTPEPAPRDDPPPEFRGGREFRKGQGQFRGGFGRPDGRPDGPFGPEGQGPRRGGRPPGEFGGGPGPGIGPEGEPPFPDDRPPRRPFPPEGRRGGRPGGPEGPPPL